MFECTASYLCYVTQRSERMLSYLCDTTQSIVCRRLRRRYITSLYFIEKASHTRYTFTAMQATPLVAQWQEKKGKKKRLHNKIQCDVTQQGKPLVAHHVVYHVLRNAAIVKHCADVIAWTRLKILRNRMEIGMSNLQRKSLQCLLCNTQCKTQGIKGIVYMICIISIIWPLKNFEHIH